MKLRPLFMLTCSVADLRGQRVRRPFTRHPGEIHHILTFLPFPGRELDTGGTCLSPPGVFSLWRQNKFQPNPNGRERTFELTSTIQAPILLLLLCK